MRRAFRFAQLAQCLGFDLADAFAGQLHNRADFLQRARRTVVESKAQTQHGSLPIRQLIQLSQDYLAQVSPRGGINRRLTFLVLYHIGEVRLLFVSDGGFEAHRFRRQAQYLSHPGGIQSHGRPISQRRLLPRYCMTRAGPVDAVGSTI